MPQQIEYFYFKFRKYQGFRVDIWGYKRYYIISIILINNILSVYTTINFLFYRHDRFRKFDHKKKNIRDIIFAII